MPKGVPPENMPTQKVEESPKSIGQQKNESPKSNEKKDSKTDEKEPQNAAPDTALNLNPSAE